MYIFSQKDNIINQNINFLNFIYYYTSNVVLIIFYNQDSGKFFITKIVPSACPYIKFFEPSPHQTVAQKI